MLLELVAAPIPLCALHLARQLDITTLIASLLTVTHLPCRRIGHRNGVTRQMFTLKSVRVGSTPVLKIALPSSPLPELPESHWSRNLEDGDTYIQLVCQPDTIGATHNHVPSDDLVDCARC